MAERNKKNVEPRASFPNKLRRSLCIVCFSRSRRAFNFHVYHRRSFGWELQRLHVNRIALWLLNELSKLLSLRFLCERISSASLVPHTPYRIFVAERSMAKDAGTCNGCIGCIAVGKRGSWCEFSLQEESIAPGCACCKIETFMLQRLF